MAGDASVYRYGDLLALARRSWVLAMERELKTRGYDDYRITDAGSLRSLQRVTLNVGHLASVLGVSRQAARKVAHGLEVRSFARTEADPEDARKVNIVLTEAGAAYAAAIGEVIEQLNRQLAGRVSVEALSAADEVLRATITEPGLRKSARRIPSPSPSPSGSEGPAGREGPVGREGSSGPSAPPSGAR